MELLIPRLSRIICILWFALASAHEQSAAPPQSDRDLQKITLDN